MRKMEKAEVPETLDIVLLTDERVIAGREADYGDAYVQVYDALELSTENIYTDPLDYAGAWEEYTRAVKEQPLVNIVVPFATVRYVCHQVPRPTLEPDDEGKEDWDALDPLEDDYRDG
ncbi:hypothetical protein J4439_02975 [Candidatus Woesearchaeota archaeon]|nr:hypothetical protein [Candidatus Woesearchaeota archaeon]